MGSGAWWVLPLGPTSRRLSFEAQFNSQWAAMRCSSLQAASPECPVNVVKKKKKPIAVVAAPCGAMAEEPSTKRQRVAWRMGSICSGIGACHRAAAWVKQANPSLDLRCVFACETARAARKVLRVDFPDILLFGDACEEGSRLPHCDVLTAGFPCQPFSPANRHRLASEDPRCDVVDAILAYAERVRPKVVILENVIGLMSWGKDVLLSIVATLQRSGYRLNVQTLSSDIHGGVPQNRRRLYVVGLLDPQYLWQWPLPIPMATLPSLLDDVVHDPASRPRAPRAAEKLGVALRRLDELDAPASARAHVVVNCHSQAGEIFVYRTPCLTANRAAQGGFWLAAHSRMMTVDELLRLQGIDPSSTRMAEVVSARTAGMLIGNAFTMTVVGRVLVSALRSFGQRVEDPAVAAPPL